MPTYEYICNSCGNRFERLLKMTDETVQNCPECGEEAQRLMSAGIGILVHGKSHFKEANDFCQSCCQSTDSYNQPPCKELGMCGD